MIRKRASRASFQSRKRISETRSRARSTPRFDLGPGFSHCNKRTSDAIASQEQIHNLGTAACPSHFALSDTIATALRADFSVQYYLGLLATITPSAAFAARCGASVPTALPPSVGTDPFAPALSAPFNCIGRPRCYRVEAPLRASVLRRPPWRLVERLRQHQRGGGRQ